MTTFLSKIFGSGLGNYVESRFKKKKENKKEKEQRKKRMRENE